MRPMRNPPLGVLVTAFSFQWLLAHAIGSGVSALVLKNTVAALANLALGVFRTFGGAWVIQRFVSQAYRAADRRIAFAKSLEDEPALGRVHAERPSAHVGVRRCFIVRLCASGGARGRPRRQRGGRRRRLLQAKRRAWR